MGKIKPSATDFTATNMPQTRFEVFWDVVKLHWKKFLLYGLLFLLVTFPLHLFTVVEDIQIGHITQGFAQMTADEQAQVSLQVVSLKNAHALMNIPFVLLVSLFLAGFLRVIRQYGWVENVVFSWDFSTGFKQNFWQTFGICAIFAVVQAVANYSCNMALLNNDTGTAILTYLPLGFLLFILTPILAYSCVCIAVYSNSFKDNLYTGFALMAKTPLKTLLATLSCIAVYLLQFIPNMVAHIVLAVVGSFLAPFIALAWFLFASNQMDKHLNAKYFPELVGKGTYKATNPSNDD